MRVRGFGPKAIDAVEQEAAFRRVSLLQAVETAELPPKAGSAGLAFADVIRGVGRDRFATVADQISLLLDATGYRAMLRESKAETTVTITYCEFRRGYTSPSSFIEDLPAVTKIKGWLRGQTGSLDQTRSSSRVNGANSLVRDDRRQAFGG